MPTFDEVYALLPRDAWMTLAGILSTLALGYAQLCLRRPLREKTREEVLVDNVLARLGEQTTLEISGDTVGTPDLRFCVNVVTGALEIDAFEVHQLLSRGERKRLREGTKAIVAEYLRRLKVVQLNRAVRLTAPAETPAVRTGELDWIVSPEGDGNAD